MHATSRSCALITCAVLISNPFVANGQWYLDQPFRQAALSTVACDVIRSPFTQMIEGGLTLQGNPATGRLYATLNEQEVEAIRPDVRKAGVEVVERHTLADEEAASLSRILMEAGDQRVPFYVQVVAGLPQVHWMIGQGFILLDYLLQENPSNSAHARAVGEIIRHGGEVARLLTIQDDSDGNPWVGQHIVLHTSINEKALSYVLCSAHFALRVVEDSVSPNSPGYLSVQ